MRKVEVQELRYYRYVILFNGQIKNEKAIIKISDLSELKLINKGRMHLFDEEILPVLPAIEYCLHMPRTELDTYDTDTEILDRAYDVSHDIVIMPERFIFGIHLLHATLIIYSDDCSEEIKSEVKKIKAELGAVSVLELSQDLLVNQWNILFENRVFRNRKKLKDINEQYLLDEDTQLLLPVLYTARQYGKVDAVYKSIFNTTNIFETCTKLIWNQLVHHNALMSCKDFSKADVEEFRKIYEDGLRHAEKTTRLNVVITMPGVPRRQVTYGGLASKLPNDEKKIIRLLGVHRAIAKEAVLIELPVVEYALFEKLNELEINCIRETNNKYVNKALRDIGKMLEKKFTQVQLWAVSRAKHITVFSDFPVGLAIIGNSDTSLQGYKEISYRPISPLTRCLQNEMKKHRQIHYGIQCKIAFAECVLNDEENRAIRACSNVLVSSLKKLSKENQKLQISYGETLTVSDLKKLDNKNKSTLKRENDYEKI